VRQHFGAGLAWYTWGGMQWNFTVMTPDGRVKVEYGDRVYVLDDGIHVEKMGR
jgi:hypothetical protein